MYDLSVALSDVGDVALRREVRLGSTRRLDKRDVAVDANACTKRNESDRQQL